MPGQPPRRSALEAAYDAGAAARRAGLPVNACPHRVAVEPALACAWLNGYHALTTD